MKTFFNLKQTQSFSAFQEISCTFVGESVQNLGLNYPRGAFFLFLCGAHRMSLTLEGRRCYYKHRVPPTQSPFLWAVGEQLGYRGAVAATLLLRRASLGASAGQVAKRDFSTWSLNLQAVGSQIRVLCMLNHLICEQAVTSFPLCKKYFLKLAIKFVIIVITTPKSHTWQRQRMLYRAFTDGLKIYPLLLRVKEERKIKAVKLIASNL